MIVLQKRIIFFLIPIFYLVLPYTANCAILWKDDFNDELIHELTWDTKQTTGTPELEKNRCVLKTNVENKVTQCAIGTLPSRAIPPNFQLMCAVEFSSVAGGKGEFYIRVGEWLELVVSFEDKLPSQMKGAEKTGKVKQIYVRDAITNKYLTQTSGSPAWFSHKISSGERYYITWMSNGETPSTQNIKIGTGPGESNIADFIIETRETVAGKVEIGIRDGLKEVRLNYVRAYLFGTTTTLVNDWVLF